MQKGLFGANPFSAPAIFGKQGLATVLLGPKNAIFVLLTFHLTNIVWTLCECVTVDWVIPLLDC